MAKKKPSRAERRAEEERILAEMEEAMKSDEESGRTANGSEEPADPGNIEREADRTDGESAYEYGNEGMPERFHCRKCGTLMENGVCPKCGYKMYVPMDEAKVRKIRLIVGVICVAAFLVFMIVRSAKG